MKINLVDQPAGHAPSVIFVNEETEFSGYADSVEQRLGELRTAKRLSGKSAEVREELIAGTVYYIAGLAESEKLDYDRYRQTLFNVFKTVRKESYTALNIYIPKVSLSEALLIKITAEMSYLAQYHYDQYKTVSHGDLYDKYEKIAEINIVADREALANKQALADGEIAGMATLEARRLVDAPPNLMTAKQLASQAEKLADNYGFDCDILTEDKIAKLGMNAYLAVAAGSSNRPHLIVMRYRGAKHSDEVLGLVGKGLTYDSGGFSVKSGSGLINMKTDMAGGAAVIGAMCAIAKAQLDINVVAVVAACENGISSKAYRPDDILTTMSGKTIRVKNTDAEGRLTLVDALTYIQREEKVTKIVDLATLTGSAIQMLGNVAAVTLSTDDDFYSRYHAAAKSAAEKEWRMPFYAEYDSLINDKTADYSNLGGKPGAITAAVLLKCFIEEERPWVHVDIAGVAYCDKPFRYFMAGATGYGVRTLYELAKSEG